MSNACTPVLVGVASLVLEIKLAFNFVQISFLNVNKLNRIELAQKNLCK